MDAKPHFPHFILILFDASICYALTFWNGIDARMFPVRLLFCSEGRSQADTATLT